MPLGWAEEHYKDKLRGFFLDMDWITPRDNESKLIMIPLIQVLAEDFQDFSEPMHHLDRERTSVLFSVKPANEDDRAEFSCTFFKMQSAKELIAVSKTLASSDFFLVPSTIGSSKSIYLENLRNVMYNAVKKIIVSAQSNGLKCATGENTANEYDPAWVIVCWLAYIQDRSRDRHDTLEEAFKFIRPEKDCLQGLKSWTCSQLTAAVFEDVNVKHYFKQMSSYFKEALGEYGMHKKSPDGIQHILLYGDNYSTLDGHDFSRVDYTYYIKHILKEDNAMQVGEGLRLLTRKAQYAMQQSYKMIQIANAVLPPVVVGDEEKNDSTFQTCKRTDGLIAPNSFYVQANVTETQISFILNKVIEVPSSENAVSLFTVQERSVEIEDIVETVSHLLWNHYQFIINLEEQKHALFQHCQKHDNITLLSSHYTEFNKSVRKLLDFWFAAEDTLSGDGLDAYYLVSVDQRCTCALKLSQRMFLEVGLKPAIISIATFITSALFSNDFFGFYQLSVVILEKNLKTIKNPYFLCAIDQTLKHTLKRFLQVHHSRLLLLFYDKHTKNNVLPYLGQGSYSQVLNANYTFRFQRPSESNFIGLMDDGVCKIVPFADSREVQEFTYSGLDKEADLPLEGISLTFPTKNLKFSDIGIDLEIFMSSRLGRSTTRLRVGSLRLRSDSGTASCSPVSIRILPVHCSSTVKFVASCSFEIDRTKKNYAILRFCLGKKGYVHELEDSIIFHERLHLKKQPYV
ncbi:hypothetical protein MAM1_0046c03140 [Mucor ambiguus]|uniref:Uncharacterized protein n=1 Tax=Mucor ambiguus TaxID=91626 RepID=A0A0C9LTE8_9FUNG|nr:hypothetical protein MAM1_0046c03140 [Mucor ambiguus]